MKHYLNICNVDGKEIPPVDVVTFGSPCQDLSVAGKRAGLKHTENGDEETTRSGLFMEAIRVIKEMRESTNGKYPTFAVWENVLGAFSSNKGQDFRIVLEELCRIKDQTAAVPMPKKWGGAGTIMGDGYSVAWRVLDAQYYGVPQRRRRIFLVADFAGERAGKILFKPESVSGYTPQGFRSWQKTSGSAEKSVGVTDEQSESIVLDDQGGNQINVRTDGKSPTLRAETHGNLPCVLQNDSEFSFDKVLPFDTTSITSPQNGANPQFGNPCHTLTATQHPPAIIAIENHPNDSRVKFSKDNKIQSLTSRMGTGGGNVPMVMEQIPYTMKIRSGCEGGGKGPLIQKNKSATLATNNDQYLFQPTIYAICSYASNSMKSGNPHSGIYEAKKSRTLDLNGGNPACNQGGMCIVEPTYAIQGSMIGRKDENGPQGNGINQNISFTLNATDVHGVCFTQDAYDKYTENDVGTTLKATGGDCGMGSETLVLDSDLSYIVRRLTPTECARLQGFPDRWGEIDKKTDFTDEEYQFWHDVRNTHAAINDKTVKEYTKPQMLKWYNKLHTDSAEYKMWGNGVALPCVGFVLSRVAEHGAKTLGSLFDGSGGFPLAGLLYGIKPLWSSEIEPYPIAVTCSRFV